MSGSPGRGMAHFGDALFLVKLESIPTKFQNVFSYMFLQTRFKFGRPSFFPEIHFHRTGVPVSLLVFWVAFFCHHCRRSNSAIASFLRFQNSRHLIVVPLHIFIHDPNQIVHFQLSHIVFVPVVTHILFRQKFFSPSGSNYI